MQSATLAPDSRGRCPPPLNWSEVVLCPAGHAPDLLGAFIAEAAVALPHIQESLPVVHQALERSFSEFLHEMNWPLQG